MSDLANWLRWIFLESPAALGVLCFLGLFFLLVRWRRGGGVRPLLWAAGITAALFLVQSLVVTLREHALAILGPVERDLERGRTAALSQAMSRSFRSAGRDANQFLDLANERVHSLRVNRIANRGVEVLDSGPDRFRISAAYTCDVNVREASGNVPSRWEFEFVNEDGQWKISAIRPTWILTFGNVDWDTITRY